jgi:hypothetical protein
MKKILLISDTHNSLDDAVVKHAKQVDEVWHAGDIGSLALLEKLQSITTVRAVYGNIDGQDLRIRIPQVAVFECEGLKVMMTHIGGYPKHYEQSIYAQLLTEKPKLFISGHSHILKVMNDPVLGLLHMNPGAMGTTGFHKKRTMLTFEIENGTPRNLAVIELDRW